MENIPPEKKTPSMICAPRWNCCSVRREYVETSVEVDPQAELSGVYRYVGAGGTCERPTRKTAR